MKARVLSFYDIEERFKEILTELERRPLDEEHIVEKGSELLLVLGVCISQMKAADSTSYPEKRMHLATLETATAAITYKINTCTVDEVAEQVNAAYRAFGVQ
jgi:hypothetical protein